MTEEQRNKFIAKQLNDGISLSVIQDLLKTEFDENLTYMELRMLSSELEDINWKGHDDPEDEEESITTEDKTDELLEADSISSGTTVSVNKIIRPGAAMSGDVQFSSGAAAEWFIDNSGQLGLNPKDDQKPTQEDLAEFQEELKKQLSGA
ncbi:MAG: hypothetical protein U9O87_10875 [Verrucomicrobiota bacterium]|nr:hypothetical protein [Verrucomicrobiota bacterium]